MKPEVHTLPVASPDSLVAVYGEICKSYHAIDDFRMKLLGLLPFTSLAAILLVNKEALLLSTRGAGSELLGFAAVFAAAFTLTLFVYEVRGILRCDGLIKSSRCLTAFAAVGGRCDHEAAAAETPSLGALRFDCRLGSPSPQLDSPLGSQQSTIR